MKFPTLRHSPVKTKRIRCFDGGVNMADPPYAILENQLSECRNMCFEDGVLRRRKGLMATSGDRINTSLPQLGLEAEYRVYNTQVNANGTTAQIATCTYYEYDSAYTVYVHFIAANGTKTSGGQMVFSRTSESSFYIPKENFTLSLRIHQKIR